MHQKHHLNHLIAEYLLVILMPLFISVILSACIVGTKNQSPKAQNVMLTNPNIIIKYHAHSSQSEILTLNARKNMMKHLDKTKLLAIHHVASKHAKNLTHTHYIRPMATGAHVIQFKGTCTCHGLNKVLKELRSQADVEYVEEDKKVFPLMMPDFNPVQWNMQQLFVTNPTLNPSISTWNGDNFLDAWKLFANSNLIPGQEIIIAVIDSGYTPHQNFISNLISNQNPPLTYGYTFISDCRIAGLCPVWQTQNTKISPQPDGLDLGDYLTQNDIDNSNGFFEGCDIVNKSQWHGSHVTGIAIAQGYNAGGNTGVLGGAYGAKVLPIRALGKCGGTNSDVIDAILYAAGQHPTIYNSNKAQIINMSLGSASPCSKAKQDAINIAVNSGTILVAAAGNSQSNIDMTDPADCQNVITVAAVGPTRNLASYSNYGLTTIAAAGGDIVTTEPPNLGSILSTIWSSSQAYQSPPVGTGMYGYLSGTSMAAPHASAAITNILSLLAAKYGSYDGNVNKIIQVLQNTASYEYNNCNLSGCVTSGILDAGAAIKYLTDGSYTRMLTPDPAVITFQKFNSPVNINISNNNTTPIKIQNINLTNSTNFFLSPSSTCTTNMILAPGSFCTLVVSASSGVASTKLTSFVQVIDENNLVLATAALANSQSAPTPTPTPTPVPEASKKGGGCTMVSGHNDFGILIMLLLGCMIYIYRSRHRS